MNKLENQIRNQRNKFDGFEPPEGHLDRFARKLNRKETPFFARIPYAVKAAAVLLLVAASSILVYEQYSGIYSRQKVTQMDVIFTELSEIEYYYTSLIEEKYNAIDRFTSDDPEQNKILLEELDQMDRMYKSLQEELQVNPADERIIHAMINHYELKLEVMAQILSQLEKVKQVTKNNSYESTEL